MVHIASYNPEECAKVLSDLRARFPEHASRFLIHPLDLSSIRSASESARAFAASADNSRLDILVANAGIMFVSSDGLSVDGYDPVFATNHLGHFAFVMGLLPLMERTANEVGDARIVVVSSLGYKFVSGLNLSDVGNAKPGYGKPIRDLPDRTKRYGRSKRANILFALELHRRLVARGVHNVMVNACHPGLVPFTGIASNVCASPPKTPQNLLQLLSKSSSFPLTSPFWLYRVGSRFPLGWLALADGSDL